MFRTIAAAAALRIAATPVISVDEKKKSPELVDVTYNHYKCRLSDLPMYQPLHAQNPSKAVAQEVKFGPVHQSVQSAVSVVRVEAQKIIDSLSRQKSRVGDFFDTGKAHAMSTIDYLNEPQNVVPRSGAIAIGGVAGFIAAVRGGMFKKLVYTLVGASTVASLCYPRQAEHFVRDALCGTRKGFNIAYNFVKGVKPGDEEAVEKFSKFPTNIAELQDLFLDLYEDAKEMILPKKK